MSGTKNPTPKSTVSIQQEIELDGVLNKYVDSQISEVVEATLKEHGLTVRECKARRRQHIDDEMTTKPEAGSRIAVQWISTRTLDRDGEILVPSGAILDGFLKAPQVFVNHNYLDLPVGSDERVVKSEWGIMARTRYATTPAAQDVFTLKQEGHLKTQSVGFTPVEWVDADDGKFTKLRDKLIDQWAEFKKNADKVRRIYLKWVVFEHSDVGIPSNIDALQVAVAKGLTVNPETWDKIGIRGMDAGPTTKPPPEPPPEPEKKSVVKPVVVVKEVQVVREVEPVVKTIDDGSL